MLKINGKINYVLFSMIPDEASPEEKDFNGKILINNLNGKFINGFRVENGKIISRLVNKTTNKCESDYWVGYDLGCDQSLDEVIITTSNEDQDLYTIQIDYIYNFSGGGSDSYYYDFQGYDGGASWGGSTTTTPIPDEEEAIKVDETEEFKKNDKINCTYQRLKKVSTIQEILKDFFGDDAIFDVTFNVVENLNCNGNTNASGCTTDLGSNAYRIDIDLGYINDPTTPTIFLAQSLIHEAVHANLFAAVKKLNNGVIPRDSSFEALYDQYRQIKGWHHEVMAAHYTGIMQEALRGVHPYLNDSRFLNGYSDNSLWNWDNFYKYLSYRGLKDTQVGGEYYANNEEETYLYESEAKLNSSKNPNCN